MKNNAKGLAIYVAYILLSFFIMFYGVLYVQTFVAQEGFFQGFMRFLVFVVVFLLPVGLGYLALDVKQPEKKDFTNGILVIVVALILYILAILMSHGNNFIGTIPSGAEGDGWRFFKFFAMPGQVYVYCITLESSYNALYLMLTCCLPTFLYGLGIKAKRKQLEKKALEEASGKKSKKNRYTKKTGKNTK